MPSVNDSFPWDLVKDAKFRIGEADSNGESTWSAVVIRGIQIRPKA
jgi:hypothetical protein